VAFLGSERTPEAGHAHESPQVMLWPLRILATLSILGGVIGIEALLGGMFEHGAGHSQGLIERLAYPFQHAPVPAFSGLAVFALGLFAAWMLYAKAKEDPLPAKLGVFAIWMRNRFYLDEIYEATFIRAHDFIAAVADWFDRWIVEGLCLGLLRGGTNLAGRQLRQFQTGNLQTYAFLFVLGVAVALWLVIGK
jgi:NADH-quinone oxidoreductase subunit L